MSSKGLRDVYPNRQSPRLRGFNYRDTDQIYFITIRAADGKSPFLDQNLAQVVVESLGHQRQSGKARVFAYMLMPDHLHVVLSLASNGTSLVNVIRDIKGFTTHCAWSLGLTGALWQRTFYDHLVRGNEDLLRICEYVIANPVRKGLVSHVEDWPYSGMPDPLPVG